MTDAKNPMEEHPQNSLPDTTMEELPAPLRAAVEAQGWTSLMPVQARAIPYLLAGREMMTQARTGSGKTAAFLLPMLELLDPEKRSCQALVLVPTRELAKQVTADAENICGQVGLETVPVYGGVGYGPQLRGLEQGCQIVVGTPGRVLDHLLRRTLTLDDLVMLIFDEADRMLSMGFYPDMKQVQRYLPDRHIHACMFSATFPVSVKNTAREFMDEPEFLSLSADAVHVTETEHVFYNVPGIDKDRTLVRIIEIENPSSAIIFCNTKSRVEYVATVLQGFGYDADALSSDLSQSQRERVLKRVRDGSLRFLVATDVASRGLDIPHLSHVVLYEPPQDVEDYIHRAGRTGRAGAAGVAISLVYSVEQMALSRIAKHYDIEMEERPLPTDEDVEAVVAERVMNLLEAKLRERRSLKEERSRRFQPLARTLAAAEEELDIIAMLLDDYYQQTLHAPPPLPEGRKRERSDDRGRRRDRDDRKPRGRRRKSKGHRRGGGGGRR